MMLQEPGQSSYDLRFSLFGFPVRVHWGFWLVAAILGWDLVAGIDRSMAMQDVDSPGAGVLLVIWIACIFLSILVHELGHTLAFRFYGLDSQIVLYHFGGLAIPSSFGSWNGARQARIGPVEQIVISAAGPALQILLGISVWLIGLALKVPMLETRIFDSWFGTSLAIEGLPSSAAVAVLFTGIIWPSLFWAVINLAPVLPLDGGQIMRNVLMLTRTAQPTRTAHMVSVVVGGLLGLWLLTGGGFGGIMFLLIAASNWQAMQYGPGGF